MALAIKSKKSGKKKSNLFQRGYDVSREEKKRQDEVRESSGKKLYNFFLREDGEEAVVRFLTEEPVNFYSHNVQTIQGGKTRYDGVACSQNDDCELCADGDSPQYKGAYLIYDKREVETKDKKTGKKKTIHGQIRLYVQGTRIVSQLDRLSSRYGLTKRDYVITRSGTGKSTTYMFDRTDDTEKLTKKEIEALLPEKLRDSYDGTMESLYSIVEEQIEMMLPSEDDPRTHSHSKVDDDDDDDEDEEVVKRHRSRLVSEDEDEDEDDEEVSKPKKKVLGKSKSGSSVKKMLKRK